MIITYSFLRDVVQVAPPHICLSMTVTSPVTDD